MRRVYEIKTGYIPNQDARYMNIFKYEDNEGARHAYIAKMQWVEFTGEDTIDPTMIVTGLDDFILDFKPRMEG